MTAMHVYKRIHTVILSHNTHTLSGIQVDVIHSPMQVAQQRADRIQVVRLFPTKLMIGKWTTLLKKILYIKLVVLQLVYNFEVHKSALPWPFPLL